MKPFDDFLRGPSVLYTYLRFLVKNQLVKGRLWIVRMQYRAFSKKIKKI